MFAKRLSELLQRDKQSIYQVAKATSISDSLLGSYKKGKVKPSTKNLEKIANYFQVTTDYLLGTTNLLIISKGKAMKHVINKKEIQDELKRMLEGVILTPKTDTGTINFELGELEHSWYISSEGIKNVSDSTNISKEQIESYVRFAIDEEDEEIYLTPDDYILISLATGYNAKDDMFLNKLKAEYEALSGRNLIGNTINNANNSVIGTSNHSNTITPSHTESDNEKNLRLLKQLPELLEMKILSKKEYEEKRLEILNRI